MNPYDYAPVPIDRHWPEILHRIRHDAHFAELVVKGLHSFTGGKYRLDADIWSGPGAPWAWSRGDGWHVQAEAAFENSTAPADVAMRNAFRAEIEYGEVEETETAKAYFAAEARFLPQPDQADWFRCRGSCHHLLEATLYSAFLWKPEAEWRVLEGEIHSTVICERDGMVFDLLEDGTDGPHPVAFAMAFAGWDTDREMHETVQEYLSVPQERREVLAQRIAAQFGLEYRAGRITRDLLREPDYRDALHAVIAAA